MSSTNLALALAVVLVGLTATGCGRAAYSDALAKTVVNQCLAKAPDDNLGTTRVTEDGYAFSIEHRVARGGFACEVIPEPAEERRAIDLDLIVWRLYQAQPPADIQHIRLLDFERGSKIGASILFSPSVSFLAFVTRGSAGAPDSNRNEFAVFIAGSGKRSPMDQIKREQRAPGAGRRFETAANGHGGRWIAIEHQAWRAYFEARSRDLAESKATWAAVGRGLQSGVANMEASFEETRQQQASASGGYAPSGGIHMTEAPVPDAPETGGGELPEKPGPPDMTCVRCHEECLRVHPPVVGAEINANNVERAACDRACACGPTEPSGSGSVAK